jgi:Sec-independent protein translocase protein TatA
VLDITPLKVLIILVVALVALGPERLPRMAHQAARAWGDFQRFRHHLGSEVRDTVLGESPTRPKRTTASEPAQPAQRDEVGPEMIRSGEEQERHPGLN